MRSNVMKDKILLYEELSQNAHPALQTEFYDGWVLRFANGYTNRANSINPLYPSSLDLHEKIAECEKRYAAQGLPVVYKLTDGSDSQIDKALEEKGYAVAAPTYVMEMELLDKEFSSGDFVAASYPDEEWLSSFNSFNRYADNIKTDTAKQILDNVKRNMICGKIVKDGLTVACGRAVVERGYASLWGVVVDEPKRGKGYGREICESLLSEAKRLGAHTAFILVEQDNHKAVNLYSKLGYRTAYSYRYRGLKIKPT